MPHQLVTSTEKDELYYISVCKPLQPIPGTLCPAGSSACMVLPGIKQHLVGFLKSYSFVMEKMKLKLKKSICYLTTIEVLYCISVFKPLQPIPGKLCPAGASACMVLLGTMRLQHLLLGFRKSQPIG